MFTWMGEISMEILSTGEKIKRARIYKGLTLKELCEDKISVSKMSCIENNKIKAEPWILEFTSKKLDINYDYLSKDVRDHLLENLENIKNNNNSINYEKELQYNLEYADEYRYDDISMSLMHLLFKYYLVKEDLKMLEDVQCKYYDVYQKVYNEENHKIYYIDMANYLFISKEYLQAANYYNNVKNLIMNGHNSSDNYNDLANIIYEEASCYVMMKEYEKAYSIIMKSIEYIQWVKEDLLKAEIYHMMAYLCLRMNDDRFSKYEEKAFKYYKEENIQKAKAMNEYASIMLELGLKDEGMEYINKGLKACPQEEKKEYIEYLLMVCDTLFKNSILEKADEICSVALDISIKIDDIHLIEKSYYTKSLICMKKESDYSAEMYMNLALDSLVKFAPKKDIYNRYLEMGKMYFKFDNVREALKYFNLAIKIEKFI
ncbi:helix-turn-helix transcriptional regulator [Hathewaya limosa]